MPRFRSVLALVASLVVAATCISLGFWQLGRYRERTEANRLRAAALAREPRGLPAAAALPPADSLALGRWRVHGSFDESRQFLLIGRSRDGAPGVHVVTPFLRDDGGAAVLVDRGFVPADDAATATPPAEPPGPRAVTGLVEPIAPRQGDPLWRLTPTSVRMVWATRWLVVDSVAAALPYAVAPVLLVELAGEGVPTAPARATARFADTTIHLSYAGQWFFFGLTALVGPIILGRARRRRAAAD